MEQLPEGRKPSQMAQSNLGHLKNNEMIQFKLQRVEQD